MRLSWIFLDIKETCSGLQTLLGLGCWPLHEWSSSISVHCWMEKICLRPVPSKDMLVALAPAGLQMKIARAFGHRWSTNRKLTRPFRPRWTSISVSLRNSLFVLVSNEGALCPSWFAWACFLKLPGVLALLCKCILMQNRYDVCSASVH